MRSEEAAEAAERTCAAKAAVFRRARPRACHTVAVSWWRQRHWSGALAEKLWCVVWVWGQECSDSLVKLQVLCVRLYPMCPYGITGPARVSASHPACQDCVPQIILQQPLRMPTKPRGRAALGTPAHAPQSKGLAHTHAVNPKTKIMSAVKMKFSPCSQSTRAACAISRLPKSPAAPIRRTGISPSQTWKRWQARYDVMMGSQRDATAQQAFEAQQPAGKLSTDPTSLTAWPIVEYSSFTLSRIGF